MFLHVPWMLLPVLVYGGLALADTSFESVLMQVPMLSGALWTFTIADMIVAVSMIVLFIEILKSTRTGGNSVVDHALSLIVFIVCLIVFLVWDRAGTSLFFFITLVALIDVMAGFSVTIRGARRDFHTPH